MKARRPSVNRVFLTRNSEYHLRGCRCMGVRERRTGEWQQEHPAVGMNLAGSYTDSEGQLHPTALPRIGEPLRLTAGDVPLETSSVLAIETHQSFDSEYPPAPLEMCEPRETS